ncbi:Uma2 family endonuclease [Crocosphaera sp. UHCC 0190]|uniref:Uma2 family endonuclease n=1 Tax=Crocosphaera sp. UHCC 0190 TaxID=3110246 RepID=UPI002B1F4618|nr:Uma2 family endonuclease [Crocosphaera sp. UHCC 0190]MEA5511497.1 Uma2 family endonuclease [Crocosphaera sp. UHCC 0190]
MLETILKSEIIYPSSDGEPMAETYIHLYAILTTLEVLKQYLSGQKATVLANQFMYYSQGFPRMRVAPDVMIIFNVEPGGRDNYKIWEEGEVPQVIFEMTSPGTQGQDQEFKKTLYEQLGVKEYWLFDPKGEWITEKLKGYRLRNDVYEIIEDSSSEPLQLQLKVEGELIGFYREDTGEKLLIPEELAEALTQKEAELTQKETELEEERQKVSEMESILEKYRQQFGELPE